MGSEYRWMDVEDKLRILVTGSRYATEQHREFITDVLREARHVEHVTLVHGAAMGVDWICKEIAHGWGWTLDPHPAEWRRYGKRAGPLRNRTMVDLGADVVLAFPMHGQVNKGTLGCVEYARGKIEVCRYWLEPLTETG